MRFPLSILFLPLLITIQSVHAQQPLSTWSDTFAPPGATNTVAAIAESENRIYIGGHFLYVGPEITNFAAFDKIEEKWIALADVAGAIEAMAVTEDGMIYVGGGFSTIGGISANAIARYDPKNDEWDVLGSGLVGQVTSLTIGPSGDLYAGGWFDTAGDVPVQNIARWDGAQWHNVGGGGIIGGGIEAFDFWGDVLYVAGRFNSAGGIDTKNVAAYHTGTMTWLSLGGGVDHAFLTAVAKVIIAKDGVYVSGRFDTTIQPNGSVLAVNNIARWDPVEEQWYALGDGTEYLTAMGVGPDGDIYINGGEFDDTSLGVLHRWDGEQWHGVVPVEAKYNAMRPASTFLSVGQRLVIGFQMYSHEMGGNPEQALYWYEPATQEWGVYGDSSTNGMTDDVLAFATVPNGTVYAGGLFRYAGTTEANHVAYWNGSSWEALGGGVRRADFQFPRVTALYYASNGMLYVGGHFDEVVQPDGTGLAARNIAAWDPASQTWHAVGGGTGIYAEAFAESADGNLYVGGYFTQVFQPDGDVLDVQRLAVWNVTTGQWEAPPEDHGFTYILSLAFDDTGALFAGGVQVVDGWANGHLTRLDPQTEAWEVIGVWNEIQVNNIAVAGSPPESGALYVALDAGGLHVWQNREWSHPGGFSSATSLALNGDPTEDGELFVGGVWGSVGNAIQRWSGSDWSALGLGIENDFSSPYIYALAVAPSETEGQAAVWVGGEFLFAGGMPSTCIARWETVNYGPSSTETPPSEQGITLQVYPNPASDRLTVAYELGMSTSVRVVLYDLLGRELAVLHDGFLAVGSGTLTSDVKHLPSGMYIVRMTADDERNSSVQRLTIVR